MSQSLSEIEQVLQFAAAINGTNKNHDLTGNSRANRIQGIDARKILGEVQQAAQAGALIQNTAHTPIPQAVSAPIMDADGNVVAGANIIPQDRTFAGAASPLTQEMIIQFLQVLDGISHKLSNIENLLASNYNPL